MGTLVDLERCARLHMGAAKLGCRKTRHHDSFHTRTLLSSLLPNPRPHPGLKLIRILSGGKVEREGDALKSALHLMSGESFWHVTLRTSLWRQTGWQDGGPVCTCQSQHPSSTTEVLTNVTNSHLRLIIYGGENHNLWRNLPSCSATLIHVSWNSAHLIGLTLSVQCLCTV